MNKMIKMGYNHVFKRMLFLLDYFLTFERITVLSKG
jgi:hypothetical protein